MALRWSSEFSVAEFQEIQADTIALDFDNNVVLLAGRRHLALKRLNDTTDLIEKFARNQRYNTSVAEWNSIAGYRHTFAITTNECVNHSEVSEGRLVTIATIKHHTRQVTDFNWHKTEPSLLASGSADASTLVWDLREYRRPVIVFSSVAGVNQVRWNKLSSYLVATAHDGDLRIWDQRKGSMPVQYIAAHSNKVHRIDWSQTHEYQLATCSQDCSVKLFDMTNPRRAESVMHTTGPVWRVSYTPWGEGLMTVVIPSSGDESGLQLWNLSSHASTGPVHTFVGPLGTVLEAQWRKDVGEFQLVTWSLDHCLRIIRIEPFLQRLCGYVDADVQADSDSDAGPSNSDAEIGTIAALESPGSPVNLSFGDTTGLQLMERATTRRMEDEFELMESWNISNITCKNTDVANRSCYVIASVNSHQVSLLISFPPSYPYNAAPSFQIEESSLVDPVLKTKLLKLLKQTAQQRVRKNRTCLDSCLSQLVLTLEGTAQLPEERVPQVRAPLGSSPARVANAASVYSSFHDDYIPYPRSSGAKFCSVGMLVVFNRPSRVSARQEPATPRSYSAATTMNFGGSYVGSYPRYGVSSGSQDASDIDSGFFLPDRSLSRGISRGSRGGKISRIVAVYDASKLFLIHKELAEKYTLNLKDVAQTCIDNAAAAASVNRSDLVQVWTLASLAAAQDVEDEMPWSKHPLSAAKMDYLIQHYTRISDLQTAAMLSCIFPHDSSPKPDGIQPLPQTLRAGRLRFKVGARLKVTSPYHTINLPETSTQPGWTVVPSFKHSRSNSWSESVEEVTDSIIEHREVHSEIKLKKPKGFDMREELKRRYADILHMWGLLEARVSVLKLLDNPPVQHSGLDFLLDCQNCKRPVIGSSFCSLCQRLTLRCSVCRVLVRGASKVCLVCGHGGHAEHIFAWFSLEAACPTGCGCNCPSETRDAFDI